MDGSRRPKNVIVVKTGSITRISTKVPKPLVTPIKSLIWSPKYVLESIKGLNKGEKGKFILTFDVETANDFVHWRSLDDAITYGRLSREAMINVMKLAEQYHIPITWHCTGHSLLEGCEGRNVRIFKWATKRNGFDNFWSTHDWFYFDPETDYNEAPEWYFGDIIQEISQSSVGHEIGSHTFSHIRCDLADEKEFIDDMRLLRRIFQKRNWNLVSHSYPWNKVGHLNLLPQFGILVFRMGNGVFPSRITGLKKNGVTLVHESLSGTPLYPIVIKFGIDVAIKKKATFTWLLHPENVYRKNDLRIFKKIIEYVTRCVKNGLLSITVLGEN
jgi:peptidoglycan/xylan/chitin deacetylase (PgdA/CDA1 family)